MKRRRVLWAGIVVVAVLALLVFQPWRAAEPRVDGKTVTRWVEEYGKISVGGVWRTNVYLGSVSPPGNLVFSVPLGMSNRLSSAVLKNLTRVTNIVNIGGRLVNPSWEALNQVGPEADPFIEQALSRKETFWSQRYRTWHPRLQQMFGTWIRKPGAPAEAVRARAAQAIGELHREALVPSLIRALGDSDGAVRGAARESIKQFNRWEDPLRSQLDAFLTGCALEVGVETVVQLRLSSPGAVQVLVAALRGSDPTLMRPAVTALAYAGERGRAAVPALTARLRTPDSGLRDAIYTALEAMGPAAEAALPSLREGLRSDDQETRYRAARVLEAMLPEVTEARALLQQAVQDEHDMVRVVAERGVGR